MHFIAGYAQFNPVRKNPQENIRRITELLEGITCDLLVLPELANTGYLYASSEDLIPFSESRAEDGPFLKMLQQMARSLNGAIVCGYAERGGDSVYNAAAAVGPDGLLANYRKTHLYADEKVLFNPGDTGFQTFTWKGVRIGMMICFDWIFPESARTLALKGAQIIAHSANLVLPYCQQAMVTRSLENHIFTITANRVGKETLEKHTLGFTGRSQMTDPKGNILHQADEESTTLHCQIIKPENALDKMISPRNHLLKDRRPDLYDL